MKTGELPNREAVRSLEPEFVRELVLQAQAVCQKAYVPYSRYPVGAAAVFSSGRMYSGCNVENASYGLTICAERNAIFQGVAQGERELKGIAIAVSDERFPSPCGACRQVMREFSADCRIILVNGKGQIRRTDLAVLLPEAFGPEFLFGE